MKRPVKRILQTGIPILAIAMVWLALRPSAIPVETAMVDRGEVRVTVEEEGETRVHDLYNVTAPVSGQLRRLELREGDRVAQGQVVAIIEPSPLNTRALQEAQARLAAALDAQRVAKANLEQARITWEQADRERQRAVSLSRDGLIAVEAQERAEATAQTAWRELDAATNREKVAEHEVEQARAVVAPRGGNAVIKITSPSDGCVLRVEDRSERVIVFGAPIMEIGDTSHLEVIADLLSEDAVRVSVGDSVEIHDWGGEAVLRGVVDVVEPSGFTKVSALGVEEQRVNVRAMLPDPPAEIGDRFRVLVRVVLWSRPGVLRVPRGAAIRSGDEWHVFAVEDGRVRDRRIEAGRDGSGFVEVRGGIQEGDVVVMYPDERIVDGVRVESELH